MNDLYKRARRCVATLALALAGSFAAAAGARETVKPQTTPSATKAGVPEAARPGPFRVGVVGPLSGISAASGKAQINGVLMAVEEANAQGGVGGRRLEVSAEDDRGLPESSVACVKSLIRGGAVAIVGAINSSCTLADKPVCAAAKTPLLTPASTATEITDSGNRWVFRCIESDKSRTMSLARYLVEELGVRSVGVIFDDDIYGRGLRNDLEQNLKKFNVPLAAAIPFKKGDPDLSGAVRSAASARVEALGLFGVTVDNIRIAGLVKSLGYSFQLFSPEVNELYAAGDAEGVEGLIATDSFYSLMDKEKVKAFSQRYESRFGQAPGPHAGRAYDAACILVDAARRADPPTGDSLREAILSTENFPGLTGVFNFKSNGDVVKPVRLVAIRGGRFVSVSRRSQPTGTDPWVFARWGAVAAACGIVAWAVAKAWRRRRTFRTAQVPPVFQPIRVNPYIVGNPIREKEMFFGREDDFQFIRKNLGRVDSGVCIVLCGERRSGKTSILYQILNGRLGGGHLPILVDLQLYGNVNDSSDFFNRVSDDIADSCRKMGLDAGLPSQATGRDRLEQVLVKAVETSGGCKIVLLLDEYEIIETLMGQGTLHPATADFFSGLLERHPSLSFVFTGSTRLEDRRAPYWRHLIGKSIYRKISFLTQADTLRLIRDPLRGVVEYADAVPAMVCRLTAGQPFYTQAICMNIVDHLNEVSRSVVGEGDLREVVAQLVENPLPQMLYFWESFSRDEKMALALLADSLADPESWRESAEILSHAKAIQFLGTPGAEPLRMSLESLYTREILTRAADRFQFRMDLLREWLKRDHSPWQVLSE